MAPVQSRKFKVAGGLEGLEFLTAMARMNASYLVLVEMYNAPIVTTTLPAAF
jgi:hypothetical protein